MSFPLGTRMCLMAMARVAMKVILHYIRPDVGDWSVLFTLFF